MELDILLVRISEAGRRKERDKERKREGKKVSSLRVFGVPSDLSMEINKPGSYDTTRSDSKALVHG